MDHVVSWVWLHRTRTKHVGRNSRMRCSSGGKWHDKHVERKYEARARLTHKHCWVKQKPELTRSAKHEREDQSLDVGKSPCGLEADGVWRNSTHEEISSIRDNGMEINSTIVGWVCLLVLMSLQCISACCQEVSGRERVGIPLDVMRTWNQNQQVVAVISLEVQWDHVRRMYKESSSSVAREAWDQNARNAARL